MELKNMSLVNPARLARRYGLALKSDDIWSRALKRHGLELVVVALEWASALQELVEKHRGEKSPHETIAESAQEALDEAGFCRELKPKELSAVVEILHLGWLYGDALLSWHQAPARANINTDSTGEVPELPRRSRLSCLRRP